VDGRFSDTFLFLILSDGQPKVHDLYYAMDEAEQQPLNVHFDSASQIKLV
jgi:hypothetical protein